MGEIVYEGTVDGDQITGTLGIEDAFSTGFKAKRVVGEPEGAASAAETSESAASSEDAADSAGESGEP